MEPIVFRSARGKLLVYLVGSLAIMIAGACLVVAGRGTLAGISIIGFSGGGAAMFAWQIFDARPRLVIDDRGVFDRTLNVGVIAWDDILDAQPAEISGQAFVALRLRNAAKYTDRLGPVHRRLVALNESLGLSALNVNLAALDADPHALAALIAREAEVRRAPPEEPYRG
jgi:hypothetical protein